MFPPSSSRELTLGLSSSSGSSYGRKETVVSLNIKNVLPLQVGEQIKEEIFAYRKAHLL
jgi:hypothetical protein